MEVDKKQVIANTNHLLCFENLSQGSQTDNNVESSPNNYVNSNNLSENSEKIHKRKLDQNDIKIEKETNINNKEEESDDKSTSETEDEEYVKPSKRRKLKKKAEKAEKKRKVEDLSDFSELKCTTVKKRKKETRDNDWQKNYYRVQDLNDTAVEHDDGMNKWVKQLICAHIFVHKISKYLSCYKPQQKETLHVRNYRKYILKSGDIIFMDALTETSIHKPKPSLTKKMIETTIQQFRRVRKEKISKKFGSQNSSTSRGELKLAPAITINIATSAPAQDPDIKISSEINNAEITAPAII